MTDTEIKNEPIKKEKPKKITNRQQSRDMRAMFSERWPKTFNVEAPLPLAKGTFEAIVAEIPDIDQKILGKALCKWCYKDYYLKSMLVAGRPRYDLFGNPKGEIEVGAAEVAAERLNGVINAIERNKKKQAELDKLYQEAVARKEAKMARYAIRLAQENANRQRKLEKKRRIAKQLKIDKQERKNKRRAERAAQARAEQAVTRPVHQSHQDSKPVQSVVPQTQPVHQTVMQRTGSNKPASAAVIVVKKKRSVTIPPTEVKSSFAHDVTTNILGLKK